MNDRFQRGLFVSIAIGALIFSLLPILILFIGAVNSATYFSFPIQSFSLRWFRAFLDSREFRSSLRVSITVAASAVTIGVLAGVPTAFAIRRFDFKGKNLLSLLVMSSMTLPRVIWAIALLQFFVLIGFLGTYRGLILAHSLLALPFVVRVVMSKLAFLDEDVENAAASLGASPANVFRRITLPLIVPGIIVGAFFGFVLSFTDAVVAVFISGARNITFPVRIYAQQRGQGLDPTAVAGSVIIVIFIVIIELIFEKLFRWSDYI